MKLFMMRKKQWISAAMIAVCFISLLGTSTVSGNTLDDLRKQLEAVQQQYRNLQNRSNQIENELSTNRKNQRAMQNEIQILDSDIEITEQRLQQVQQQLAEAEEAVRIAEQELEQAEKELAHREELRNRRVRAIYEFGTVSYLEVLFESTSFADFLSRYDQLQFIIQEDVQLLKLAQEKREEVEDRKEQLEWKREQVVALKREVEATKELLVAQKSQKQVQLASLQQVEASLTEDLEAMEETLRETDRLIDELTKKYQDAIRRTGNIVLRYPLAKQVPISSAFGHRFHPVLKTYKLHTGTDFAAGYGSKVYAAESGTVILAGWNGGYGNTVIIAHGKNVVTLYAHMSKIHVSQGQQVDRGAVIGEVGSTGLSTGPHLHFEVRFDNQPKNPLDYIDKAI